MPPSNVPHGGFSLFPNTTRPPSRTQAHRPRANTPQPSAPEERTASPDPSPHRAGRRPSADQSRPAAESATAPSNGRQSALDGRISAMDRRPEEPVVERPAPVADHPPRCGTAFSEARTLVRNGSNRSRSSIAKRPFSIVGHGDDAANAPTASASSPTEEPPALRSIFPLYNPELPPDRQNYFPTQTSPTHIPRAAISRPVYSPTEDDIRGAPVRSPVRSPVVSPMSGGSAAAAAPSRWLRQQEPPVVPATSTNEELKNLWKVTNGWKASASEGRVYCLKMTSEKDAPIYTLSSATQPFYSMRVDPTSASAYVTLSRHDPSRPFKGANKPAVASDSSSSSSGRHGSSAANAKDAKNWQEVLSTTLEEEARRHQPNDGLEALLYPQAAAKFAFDPAADAATVHAAEQECGRLVWDDDSGNHFLVHPSLELPFCVTIERSPAWSRTEYTLEHLESPQHVARLTRDGTGQGWLEVDTGIAGKIPSVYLVDVAVAALLLVAHKDERNAPVELFEPPPCVFAGPPGAGDGSGGRSGRNSRLSIASRSSRRQQQEKRDKAKKRAGKKSRLEEFEMDLESQTSEFGKLDVEDKDKLPGTARTLIKLLSVLFKFFIWILTLGFKALTAIIAGLARCLTSEKL